MDSIENLGNFWGWKSMIGLQLQLEDFFEQARKKLEENRKKTEERTWIVIHPSMITYDHSKAYSWKEYRIRKDRNKKVKKFREFVWIDNTI